MALVMALLEAMRTPPLVARRQHPSFSSIRAAVLGYTGITIQDLWSIRDARAFDLRGGTLHIPAKRVVKRYATAKGHGVVRVSVEQGEPRTVLVTPAGVEACRQYLAYPDRYNGGGKLTKFGCFAVGSFRTTLREASNAAGLEYPGSRPMGPPACLLAALPLRVEEPRGWLCKCAHHCAHHLRITPGFAETFCDFWRPSEDPSPVKSSINTDMNVIVPDFPRTS